MQENKKKVINEKNKYNFDSCVSLTLKSTFSEYTCMTQN